MGVQKGRHATTDKKKCCLKYKRANARSGAIRRLSNLRKLSVNSGLVLQKRARRFLTVAPVCQMRGDSVFDATSRLMLVGL